MNTIIQSRNRHCHPTILKFLQPSLTGRTLTSIQHYKPKQTSGQLPGCIHTMSPTLTHNHSSSSPSHRPPVHKGWGEVALGAGINTGKAYKGRVSFETPTPQHTLRTQSELQCPQAQHSCQDGAPPPVQQVDVVSRPSFLIRPGGSGCY